MKKDRIHFIGIGGIGVSALARFYKARGFAVSGSDLARSEITDALKKEGMRVYIGRHKSSNVASAVTEVISTAAARSDNPEVIAAKKKSISVMTYAEALGRLVGKFKTIAVAGAHGKTTTTALIALAMIKGNLDPTVIIGTKLREFKNSNFRRGRSKYFVLEADEYKASLLNYHPDIAVVTNLDREHLDFYKNVRNIEKTFLKFLLGIKRGGAAVLNADDSRLKKLGRRAANQRKDLKISWYSLKGAQAHKIKKILQIPGAHNISNGLAALATAKIAGISEKTALSALGAYRGAWRRFDYQGLFHGAKVFADYAHHPTEIKATLKAAREKFPKNRIWCIFQPHHYKRTRDLFGDFAKSFDRADEVVILDIYEVAGREKNRKNEKVNSAKLAEAVAERGVSAQYLAEASRLKPLLSRNVKKGDIIMMTGAGSIWEMTKKLAKKNAE